MSLNQRCEAMKPTTKPKRTAEQQAEEEALRREHAMNPVRQRPGTAITAQSFAAILSLVARFKAVRESQGQTLAEVAERMGIDPPALSRLETGKMLNPTLATLHKWAEALGQKLHVNVGFPERLVRFSWEGPLTVDEVIKTRNNGDRDQGLYQLYGQNVIFGANALLYVGSTVKKTLKNDRTLSTRLNEHKAGRGGFRWESDVMVRLGYLVPDSCQRDDNPEEWKKLVLDAEALTIFWHTPPYNTQGKESYKGQPLKVQNWFNRGSLLLEYGSEGWRDGDLRKPLPSDIVPTYDRGLV